MDRILLVEDDKEISRLTVNALQQKQFEIVTARNIQELNEISAGGEEFEVVLLDRIIDGVDMKERFPQLKKRFANILVLSAISTPDEKADLLYLGADDYLGKPFSHDELAARIHSLLRRKREPSLTTLRVGNLTLDTKRRTFSIGNNSDSLPPKEFLILECLCADPGKIWRRTSLLESVWGASSHAEDNLVEATITNLRRRLAAGGCSFKIRNTRNVGYWIET
jgi:DNA-binding response OmpR family regulator